MCGFYQTKQTLSMNITNITFENFATAVSRMRVLQVTYFKTRNSDVLKNAKEAEKKVDALLEILLDPNVIPYDGSE